MADIDRHTGEFIDNERSALQSVEIICSTRIGELIMKRQFGAGLVELLGRAMTPQLFSLYKMLLVVAIDVWEPRLRVRRVVVDGDARAVQQGAAKFSLEVDFMPNGHKGDRTVQKQLRFGLSIMGDGLKVI